MDAYITEHKTKGDFVPNLKGFIVGNGVTNWKYDGVPAYVHMSYYFGLIDYKLYAHLTKDCDLSYYNYDEGVNLDETC